MKEWIDPAGAELASSPLSLLGTCCGLKPARESALENALALGFANENRTCFIDNSSKDMIRKVYY